MVPRICFFKRAEDGLPSGSETRKWLKQGIPLSIDRSIAISPQREAGLRAEEGR
jgi:hypothetical protein